MLDSVQALMNFMGLGIEKETASMVEAALRPQVMMKINQHVLTENPELIMSKWRYQLRYEEVLEIQNKCVSALRVWGYRTVDRPEHLSSKDLMGQYKIN